MRTPLSASILLSTCLLAAAMLTPAIAVAQTVARARIAPAVNDAPKVEPGQATITRAMIYESEDGNNTPCSLNSLVQMAEQRIVRNNVGTTIHWCGRVRLDGRNVNTVDEEDVGDPYGLSDRYYAKPNRVITRSEWIRGKPWDDYIASSALVDENGDRLNVRSQAKWTWVPPAPDNLMACPENMAMIAISNSEFICGSIWQGNPVPTTPGGIITFRDAENLPCSIPVPNGPRKEVVTYMLHTRKAPCAPDWAASIELEKVPSATRILLTDIDSCERTAEDTSHFWVEVQTIEKSTTLSKINIDEFFGFSPGDIVEKGLKLIDFRRQGNEPSGKKLSCVQISTSAAPPSA